MHQLRARRLAAVLLFSFFIATDWLAPAGAAGVAAQNGATPATDPCAGVTATPADGMGGMDMGTATAMSGMDMSTATAMAGMDLEMEFDQLYIDMMIPHHGSIIAMSEAALTRLEDERLREIAQTIIDTQSAEQEELRGYREDFYGDPEPMAMDDQMMGMMGEMMPGMGSMDEMAMQMDLEAQVAAICGAEDADLAFIDQTIHGCTPSRRRRAWLDPEGASEAELKKRTLTHLYNQRPAWLAHLRTTLDRAVWMRYGWEDAVPGAVDEDAILGRLLALNRERAASDSTEAPASGDAG